MPNLYGAIVDNVASGLVGGAGIVPAECYSTKEVIFESSARHAYQDAVGKDIANPTANLLTAANMLDHMDLKIYGNKIRNAVLKTIKVSIF
jgi:isocitrate dehydrogenase (NAD+)